MLTPILQEKISKISKMELSKNILIDEYNSVGAALYSCYKYNLLTIKDFKSIKAFNSFPIKIDIGNGKKKNWISSKQQLPFIYTFKIIFQNKNIDIKFYSNDNGNKPTYIYSLLNSFIDNICRTLRKNELETTFEINEGGV